MRIKCIKNQYVKGWLRKTTVKASLSLGRKYTAIPNFNIVAGHQDSMPDLIVFNDRKQWETYPLELFEAIED